jgi:pyridoxine 4-dehydrogenase
MTNTTFAVGGDIEVRRVGFGAMRITGPGIWGPPPTELARGRFSAEPPIWASNSSTPPTLTARAFQRSSSPKLSSPTTASSSRPKAATNAPAPVARQPREIGWTPNGRPGHLRSACDASLRRLRLDRIDLYQLHTPDPAVPYAESIGALNAIRGEGKIRHIGVSNVTPEQLAVARTITDIATVQNRLNLANGDWHNMLIECESNEIGFMPYRPLRGWNDPTHEQVLTAAASRHGANTNQIALAWLLAVSPVTLPIPGTATLAHLEDNLAAASLQLEQDEIHAITTAALRAT